MNRNAFLKFCLALCTLPIARIVKPQRSNIVVQSKEELWDEKIAQQKFLDSFNNMYWWHCAVPETDVMPGLHDAITTDWVERYDEDCPACRQYMADHAEITREGVFTYGNYSIGDQVEVQLTPDQRKFLMSLDCPLEVRLIQGEHCIDTTRINCLEVKETPDI